MTNPILVNPPLFLEIQVRRTNLGFFRGISLCIYWISLQPQPKMKTKNFKQYISILVVVNYRDWLDASSPTLSNCSRNLWPVETLRKLRMMSNFGRFASSVNAPLNLIKSKCSSTVEQHSSKATTCEDSRHHRGNQWGFKSFVDVPEESEDQPVLRHGVHDTRHGEQPAH